MKTIKTFFKTSQLSEFSDILKTTNPLEIQWSEFASRLSQAFPELPIHMWCNEDSPFIWGQILRQMGQLPASKNIAGDFDLFADQTPACRGCSGLEVYKLVDWMLIWPVEVKHNQLVYQMEHIFYERTQKKKRIHLSANQIRT